MREMKDEELLRYLDIAGDFELTASECRFIAERLRQRIQERDTAEELLREYRREMTR